MKWTAANEPASASHQEQEGAKRLARQSRRSTDFAAELPVVERSPDVAPPTSGVPNYLVNVLVTTIGAAGVSSFFFPSGYSPLPVSVLIDAWIGLLVGFLILHKRRVVPKHLLLLLIVVLSRFLSFVLHGVPAPVFDLLQAFRWVVYLAVFSLFVGHKWMSSRLWAKFTFILIQLALAKAVVARLVLGATERPGLLTENNFELGLFAGLFVSTQSNLGKTEKSISLVSLGCLAVLAGSRSGAVAVLVVFMFILANSNLTRATKTFISLYVGPIILALPVLIFVARSAVGGSIDRLVFLEVFRQETADWTWIDWLWGNAPLTALSPSGCRTLAYYETLFSSAGDGSCYSVILHAFFLRVIFDAGLVGLFIAFLVPALCLRRSGVGFATSVSLLAIAAANSFSVSGLNSPYVALPFIVAIGLNARYTESLTEK